MPRRDLPAGGAVGGGHHGSAGQLLLLLLLLVVVPVHLCEDGGGVEHGGEGAEAAAALFPAPTTGELLLKTKAKTIMGVKGLRQLLRSSPLPLRESCY